MACPITGRPFFLCYAPVESERFMSIPPDLKEEFRKKYERPEKIFRTETGIEVIRYDPGSREKLLDEASVKYYIEPDWPY